MTFLEFINLIKKIQEKGSNLYRLPGGTPGKSMTVQQFNSLMSSEAHNTE